MASGSPRWQGRNFFLRLSLQQAAFAVEAMMHRCLPACGRGRPLAGSLAYEAGALGGKRLSAPSRRTARPISAAADFSGATSLCRIQGRPTCLQLKRAAGSLHFMAPISGRPTGAGGPAGLRLRDCQGQRLQALNQARTRRCPASQPAVLGRKRGKRQPRTSRYSARKMSPPDGSAET